MRRLRAASQARAPGGPGSRPAQLRGSARQGLDGEDERGRKPRDQGRPTRPPVRPRKTAPGCKIAAVERREARARRIRTLAPQGVDFKRRLLGAPLPHVCGGIGNEGAPRAFKNRGGGALANCPAGCLKIESDAVACAHAWRHGRSRPAIHRFFVEAGSPGRDDGGEWHRIPVAPVSINPPVTIYPANTAQEFAEHE